MSLRDLPGEWVQRSTLLVEPRLRDLERQLNSASGTQPPEDATGLPTEPPEMLEMLRTIQRRMLLIRQLRSHSLNSGVDITLPVSDRIIAE